MKKTIYFHPYERTTRTVGGLELRDYFAAQAMQGLLSNPNYRTPDDTEEAAKCFYECADAMMEARKNGR